MFLAGNRVGKSHAGSMEVAFHLTGQYPRWWRGKRFDEPVSAWVASETTEATRDILQVAYMGSIFEENFGTGTIPQDCIGKFTRRQGVANAIDTVQVKHKSGGWSELCFKSYDQGRAKFQGTAKHVVHLDEEPPMDIFTECTTRTMTTKGHVLLTMTPLNGMSEVCEHFLVHESKGCKYVTAGWDDAPFLSEEDKEQMEATYPAHEIDARRRGIPTVGRGKIYPFKREDISVEPFKIPEHWKQAYGMDFGWQNTAVVWGAYDEDNDTWYVYHTYKEGEQDHISHATYINTHGGEWLRGVCDPAGQASSQADGTKLVEMYRESPANLKLEPADNSVSSGIQEVYSRLRTGRLKVFSTCDDWFKEQNVYARDKNMKVVKRNDHLLDATRYLVMSGLDVARAKAHKKLSRSNSMLSRAINWVTA